MEARHLEVARSNVAFLWLTFFHQMDGASKGGITFKVLERGEAKTLTALLEDLSRITCGPVHSSSQTLGIPAPRVPSTHVSISTYTWIKEIFYKITIVMVKENWF